MKKFLNQKGFTFIELIVVITLIGILATIFMSRTSGKETAVRIQATANEVMMLYKACQDWRIVTGNATFTGISIADLQAKGLWRNSTNALGGNYTVAADVTDASRVRIDIPTPNLNASQRSQLVSLLSSRGFTSVIDNTTYVRVIQ